MTGITRKTALRVAAVLGPLLAALVAMMVLAAPATAQQLSLDLGQGPTSTGRIVQLLALLTVLSIGALDPGDGDRFTRIVVVLSFLRPALGTTTTRRTW